MCGFEELRAKLFDRATSNPMQVILALTESFERVKACELIFDFALRQLALNANSKSERMLRQSYLSILNIGTILGRMQEDELLAPQVINLISEIEKLAIREKNWELSHACIHALAKNKIIANSKIEFFTFIANSVDARDLLALRCLQVINSVKPRLLHQAPWKEISGAHDKSKLRDWLFCDD